MRLSRPPVLLLAGVAAGAAVLAAPGTAVAGNGHGHGPSVRVLNSTVGAPFQLAVSDGKLYVADGGSSTVSRVGRNGALTTVASGPQPGEVAGVAVNRRGDVAYTSTNYTDRSTALTIRKKRGGTVVADLSGFEQRRNPDARVRYGIDNPTPCQVAAFEPLGGASSTGIVDSHPYAVAALPGGGWVVADAGGNDLLKVDDRGRVSVIKVLPRQPTVITAAAAAALGLPSCVVGAVYNFDPVPTDVEVGPGGRLLVSLLPGGPEDESLGARGKVVAVSPWSGKVTTVASGFLGATNLAQDGHGRIFVTELFAGRISVVSHGRVRPYVTLPGALSVVYSRGVLYAGTLGPSDDQGNPTGPGSLVAIR